jgi:hypothetical protein
MLLYLDPGTGGVIFSGLSALLWALAGGVAAFLACLLRPVRNFFRRLWRALCRKPRPTDSEHPRVEDPYSHGVT